MAQIQEVAGPKSCRNHVANVAPLAFNLFTQASQSAIRTALCPVMDPSFDGKFTVFDC